MTPDEYCTHKVGSAGSSFYYSFLFLSRAKRRAITALYAFCREIDDIVDECSDAQVAHTKLAWWREEIDRTFRGQPNHPVSRALNPAIEHYGLPRAQFLEIIDGMQMDIEQTRYASFAELKVYCHRVASVVGLLSAAIFGYRNERTAAFARNLGLAFQLTNIIRDVGEDARRNRIYLPLEDLLHFGVEPMEILTGQGGANFHALMEFEAQRAGRFYEEAMQNLVVDDRADQIPSLIMAAIYRATLDEIGAANYPVLRARVSLTPLRKFWIAWKTQRRELRLAKGAA